MSINLFPNVYQALFYRNYNKGAITQLFNNKLKQLQKESAESSQKAYNLGYQEKKIKTANKLFNITNSLFIIVYFTESTGKYSYSKYYFPNNVRKTGLEGFETEESYKKYIKIKNIQVKNFYFDIESVEYQLPEGQHKIIYINDINNKEETINKIYEQTKEKKNKNIENYIIRNYYFVQESTEITREYLNFKASITPETEKDPYLGIKNIKILNFKKKGLTNDKAFLLIVGSRPELFKKTLLKKTEKGFVPQETRIKLTKKLSEEQLKEISAGNSLFTGEIQKQIREISSSMRTYKVPETKKIKRFGYKPALSKSKSLENLQKQIVKNIHNVIKKTDKPQEEILNEIKMYNPNKDTKKIINMIEKDNTLIFPKNALLGDTISIESFLKIVKNEKDIKFMIKKYIFEAKENNKDEKFIDSLFFIQNTIESLETEINLKIEREQLSEREAYESLYKIISKVDAKLLLRLAKDKGFEF